MNRRLLVMTSWYPTSSQNRQRTWAIANIVQELKVHGVSTVVIVPRAEHKKVTCELVNDMPVFSVPQAMTYEPFRRPRFRPSTPGPNDTRRPGLRTQFDRLKERVMKRLSFAWLYLNKYVTNRMQKLASLSLYSQWKKIYAENGPFDSLIVHGRPLRNLVLLDGLWSGPINVCFHETDLGHASTANFLSKHQHRIGNIGFRSENLHAEFVHRGFLGAQHPYHIILSGVPSSKILPREQYRERPQGEPLRLLCVTTLIPRKNVALLIRTLAVLDIPWTLDLMGRGPELVVVRQLAADLGLEKQVTFHGFVPHNEVMSAYRSHDVFVLLSEKETFGMVYTEALSQGLFVIGSAGEGIDGVIEDGKNGFLVAPEDAQRLIGILRDINSMSPSLRHEFQDRVHKLACSLNEEDIGRAYFERMVCPVTRETNAAGGPSC